MPFMRCEMYYVITMHYKCPVTIPRAEYEEFYRLIRERKYEGSPGTYKHEVPVSFRTLYRWKPLTLCLIMEWWFGLDEEHYDLIDCDAELHTAKGYANERSFTQLSRIIHLLHVVSRIGKNPYTHEWQCDKRFSYKEAGFYPWLQESPYPLSPFTFVWNDLRHRLHEILPEQYNSWRTSNVEDE